MSDSLEKATPLLVVDQSKCIKCGLCIKDCPAFALRKGAEGTPILALGGSRRCIKCQHCLMICPTGALSIDSVKPEQCLPGGELPEFDRLANLLRQRRSVRYYKHANVPQADVQEILQTVKSSPTGVNDHRVHFALIDDVAVMDELRERMYEKIKNLFADPEARAKYGKLMTIAPGVKLGIDPIFRTAPHLILAAAPDDAPCPDADPVIALSQFELLANTKGIATCWCGWVLLALKYLVPEMLECFNLPANYHPTYGMLFGYPTVKYRRFGAQKPIGISKVDFK